MSNDDWNKPPGGDWDAPNNLPQPGEGWGDNDAPKPLYEVDDNWGTAPQGGPPAGAPGAPAGMSQAAPPAGPPAGGPPAGGPPMGGPPMGGPPPGGPPAGGPPPGAAPGAPPNQQMMNAPQQSLTTSNQLEQNDIIALVVSFFFPGFGHLMLGQTAKGLAIFFGLIAITVVTCGIGALAAPLALVDAYMVTMAQKKRPVGDWEFFPKA